MLIREEVVTRAAPERVWELVSDPALHDLWNPRIVHTESAGFKPGVGHRYRVTYELSGKRTEMDAVITDFKPGERFAARLQERYQGDGRHLERTFEESYLVRRHGARTRVRHDISIRQSGINVWLRLLIWLVMKTGKPTGQPYLERLRELAESEGEPPLRAAGHGVS